jgi:hypothetical protein
MEVRETSEFGPVSLYTVECGICGHRVRVSVERVIDVEETKPPR